MKLIQSLLGQRPLITINPNGLKDLLLGFSGISLAGMETLTNVGAKKTNNPFKDKTILKQSRLLVNIGGRYANWLENQAKRENLDVEFIVKERKWGERIDGTSLVYYNVTDLFYLEVLVVKVFETIYTDVDGNILTKEEVAPFLPKKRESSTQAPLTKKVYLRDYKFESIRKFAFDGKVYLVG